jgi:hypothetical protein
LEVFGVGRRTLMKATTERITSLEGQEPTEASTGSSISHLAVWWARTTIEVMAISVGVAALPVSVPFLVACKVLEIPGRVVADTVVNGTAPLVGPPIARTVDRVQGYAA